MVRIGMLEMFLLLFETNFNVSYLTFWKWYNNYDLLQHVLNVFRNSCIIYKEKLIQSAYVEKPNIIQQFFLNIYSET